LKLPFSVSDNAWVQWTGANMEPTICHSWEIHDLNFTQLQRTTCVREPAQILHCLYVILGIPCFLFQRVETPRRLLTELTETVSRPWRVTWSVWKELKTKKWPGIGTARIDSSWARPQARKSS
jgi:hypothetical protein